MCSDTDRCPPPESCVEEPPPLDGVAIDEQAWAHYHAGEYERARHCVTEFWLQHRSGLTVSVDRAIGMYELQVKLDAEH